MMEDCVEPAFRAIDHRVRPENEDLTLVSYRVQSGKMSLEFNFIAHVLVFDRVQVSGKWFIRLSSSLILFPVLTDRATKVNFLRPDG